MKKTFALLLVLLLASLACNAALGGKSTPELPPITVDQPPTALIPPTLTPKNLTPDTSTLTPETPALSEAEALPLDTIKSDNLEHKWAARSFSEPETGADPDMADGEPDVTNCTDPVLPTWAPPASPNPAILTLIYAAPLVPSQVNVFHIGSPAGILRVEVLNSLSGLGRLIYDSEKDKVSASGKCPATLSLPVKADIEVDTVIVTIAASENPPQIDAVELVGELRGYLDLPVFWRVPLPGVPIGLAANETGLIYLATDPDGLFHQEDPAHDELYTYDVEGNQLKKFSIPSGADLTDVAADPFGNLVVVDKTYGWFIILSPEGEQLATGGEHLAGQVAVSLQDGNVYILRGNSIRVYTSDTGKFLREMLLNDIHSYISLAFDPQGRLYTLRDYDWAAELFQLDPLTGEELDAIPLESSSVVDIAARDLAIDASGNFYILFSMNTGDIAVHMLDAKGIFLRRYGKLTYDPEARPDGVFFEPREIAVTPDGRFLLIADGTDGDFSLTAYLLEVE